MKRIPIPKGKDDIIIKTKNGNQIKIDRSTFNIYNNNAPVNEAIADIFETVKLDTNIDSLEITDKRNKSLLEIKKDEFDEMSIKSKIDLPDENSRIIYLQY